MGNQYLHAAYCKQIAGVWGITDTRELEDGVCFHYRVVLNKAFDLVVAN
jgi:hypothetical protein